MNSPGLNSEISFLVYVLFGSIGLGYFVYGKRQKKIIPLLCGVSLMVYPYFVTHTILLVGIGLVLLGVPYFIRY